MAVFSLRYKILFIVLAVEVVCTSCFSQPNPIRIFNELKEFKRTECFYAVKTFDSFPGKYPVIPDSTDLHIDSSIHNFVDSLLMFFSDTCNFKISKLIYSCSFQGSNVLEITSCNAKIIFLISKSCKKSNFYINRFDNLISSVYFSNIGMERIQNILIYIKKFKK